MLHFVYCLPPTYASTCLFLSLKKQKKTIIKVLSLQSPCTMTAYTRKPGNPSIMGCSVAKSTAVCPLCGAGMRILIHSYLEPIPRFPWSTGLLVEMQTAAMTVEFSAVSIYGYGRLGRMGEKNASAHTQAWSSYGEVHETVRTVCEYNVDESGITGKIIISITGSLHWYPVPQNRHTGLVVLGRSPRNCGHYMSGQQREVRHETKLSTVCTVGLHLRRHGLVLGFRFRF